MAERFLSEPIKTVVDHEGPSEIMKIHSTGSEPVLFRFPRPVHFKVGDEVEVSVCDGMTVVLIVRKTASISFISVVK